MAKVYAFKLRTVRVCRGDAAVLLDAHGSMSLLAKKKLSFWLLVFTFQFTFQTLPHPTQFLNNSRSEK